MQGIDIRPTHEYQGYKIRPASHFRSAPRWCRAASISRSFVPFGANYCVRGVNFSSRAPATADSCTMVLVPQARYAGRSPKIRFPGEFRIGNVFSMTVFDLDDETIEYGFRMDRAFPAERGEPASPLRPRQDPAATPTPVPSAAATCGATSRTGTHLSSTRSRVVFDDFDWEGDRPLEIPLEDLVIYEMHVRGFTRHPSSESTSRRRAPSRACARRSPT